MSREVDNKQDSRASAERGEKKITRKFILVIVLGIICVNVLISFVVKHTDIFKCPMRKYKAEREAQMLQKEAPAALPGNKTQD